ncbi:MAG: hypothetical protein LUD77_11145 [Clostridiales bacterium]|nr:hypothetical protein [Clostridiales bacterium]
MDINEKTENKFSKETLRKSKLFSGKKDLISAVLKDGESYTKKETEELINNYLTKEVM